MNRAKPGARSHQSRKLLAEVILQLQQIHSAVTVAVAALKQQNSELDVDIANVLQRGAADKIQDQLEKIEAVQSFISGLERK